MQGMRSHHDSQRPMLPLRELREHERVSVNHVADDRFWREISSDR